METIYTRNIPSRSIFLLVLVQSLYNVHYFLILIQVVFMLLKYNILDIVYNYKALPHRCLLQVHYYILRFHGSVVNVVLYWSFPWKIKLYQKIYDLYS